MLRIHQSLQAAGFPNASMLAREVEGFSTKTIHRDIGSSCATGSTCRLNSLRPITAIFTTAKSAWAFPTMQITEGEIFALVVAEKALQQYRAAPASRSRC